METISNIKEIIEEIKNTDFEVGKLEYYGKYYNVVKLLRNILICENKTGSLKNITQEEEKELYKELDDVFKNKLKKLNPEFNEEILNKMLVGCRRGYIIYPMDIFVLDDAVFHKEGVFDDDYIRIYKIETFMFKNMKPYYDITDLDFTYGDYDSCFIPNKEILTKEENIYTSKFISDNINLIYGSYITKPIYEFNTETIFHGYSGLVCEEVNVYVNMQFDDIGRSLKEKRELDIKLCIQDKDNIILYYVHQSFKDDKPVWEVVNTYNEVWRLTEEVLKLKK